ncbi:hypothetical protein CHARACLAT_016959 [Characodon lateralis]|uniref:Secreted protein n=1 Tax=Characodon lateralis TaxID=208331 RepID=A0ABU7EAC3_9TELE|nr:hypothetical protein [Characodon lateralis]
MRLSLSLSLSLSPCLQSSSSNVGAGSHFLCSMRARGHRRGFPNHNVQPSRAPVFLSPLSKCYLVKPDMMTSFGKLDPGKHRKPCRLI